MTTALRSGRRNSPRLALVVLVSAALALPLGAPSASASSWASSVPVRVLQTKAAPYGVAFDGKGRMYVTTWDGGTGRLSRYPANWRKPSTKPQATITPGGEGMLLGVGADNRGGTYVVGYREQPYDKQVQRYSANWTSSTRPAASASGLFDPALLALDATGAVNVAVWNGSRQGYPSELDKVVTYGRDFEPGADPIRTLSGPATQLSGPGGLAFDRSGRLYVTNSLDVNRVTIYAPGASGDTAPVAVIEGPDTGLSTPAGIVVDARGRIYVANADANTITVYAPGTSGNAAPLAVLQGPETQLSGPYGLAFDRDGRHEQRLVVTNSGSKKVTMYRPFSG